MAKHNQPRLRYISRPGHRWTPRGLRQLVHDMRRLADRCFDDLPRYQALSGERAALRRALVTTARDRNGTLVGFSSGVLMEAEGLGPFLHLGLTCVDPTARGSGLTGRLNAHLVRGFLLRTRPLGRVWVSSVACVKSSLGNVALHFDNVFPSPFSAPRPSDSHLAIARAVNQQYRNLIHIQPESNFDENHFVFRGGAKNTAFQKRRDDERYLHRHARLNQFYDTLMDFENGDLILQVASASAWTGIRHAFGLSERAVQLGGRIPALASGKS